MFPGSPVLHPWAPGAQAAVDFSDRLTHACTVQVAKNRLQTLPGPGADHDLATSCARDTDLPRSRSKHPACSNAAIQGIPRKVTALNRRRLKVRVPLSGFDLSCREFTRQYRRVRCRRCQRASRALSG